MKASYQDEEDSRQQQDPYGKSKIFKAVEESNVKDLAIAIFAGGDVNQCTTYGDSPLQVALCSETIRPNVRSAIVSQLLRAKADPNYVNPSEEGTDDSEGLYYIAEGALRLYTTSDYLECLSSLAGQDNQHDSDDF